ncbi:hypothetical protein [Pedobacter sp. L105]|uniref:hypothetical protein n=1 Tax=Pedobacter sp. L105 TaxID=1641871 RepID=UPI00131B98CE|nr:hypothetical protein [Pedobacter sp. L105]
MLFSMGPALHRQQRPGGRVEKHRGKPVSGWLVFSTLWTVRGDHNLKSIDAFLFLMDSNTRKA